MSRLIDADKLKHVIHCAYSDDLEILEKIDEQPTAFDVDKVISELKRDKFIESECILPEKDNGDYPANTFDAGFVEGWNQCIDEIAGGNADD